MKIHVIIVAGGIGSRMNSAIPKQYLEVNGVPVFMYSFKKFASCEEVSSITIVLSDEWRPYVQERLSKETFGGTICFAPAGVSRQHSVWNGLNVIKSFANPNDLVFIHDSVRPLFPVSIIYDEIEACRSCDAALPVVPVKDAMYHSVDGERLSSLVPREEYFFGQSPECLVFEKIMAAHSLFSDDELLSIHGCSELAFRANLSVKLVAGADSNFKITTIEDLNIFRNFVINE